MNNFCTLFDSNFIVYGLALYDSLVANCKKFSLYVVAFDDSCYDILKSMDLDNMIVISLAEFENEKLLSIKNTRSKGEYCWTCTPSVIKYCLTQYKLDHCIYVDSDIFFYDDPMILLDGIGDNSVLITPHWYHSSRDFSQQNGKYCVQFVYFKNDENGSRVLDWWLGECIKWCYNRFEDGKFGDQKYLDQFQTQFEGVYELSNRGGGIAPWNVKNYTIEKAAVIRIKYKLINYNAVFYHFHGLRIFVNAKQEIIINLGGYKLPGIVKEIFYRPYIKVLKEKNKLLYQSNFKNKLNDGFTLKKELPIKEKIYNIIHGIYNTYDINKITE